MPLSPRGTPLCNQGVQLAASPVLSQGPHQQVAAAEDRDGDKGGHIQAWGHLEEAVWQAGWDRLHFLGFLAQRSAAPTDDSPGWGYVWTASGRALRASCGEVQTCIRRHLCLQVGP